MTTVTAQALQKVAVMSQGKERLKRKAFRRPRKTDIEGADVTFSKYVQRPDRPTVDSRV